MTIEAGDLNANPNPNPTEKKEEEKKTFGVEIDVGGKKFVVSEEMARSINAEKAQLEGQVRTTLQSFESRLSQLQPPETKTEESKGANFWDNPEAYFLSLEKKFDTRLQEAVKGVETNLTNRYQAENNAQKFWDSFYSDNKDLVDDRFLVDAVMRRDYEELKDLKAPEAKKVVADRVRQELLRYTKTEANDKSPVIESGGERLPRKREPQEEKVVSLTEQIRAKKEARRKAKYKESA